MSMINIFALAGKSGSGKTTICEKLEEKYPDKYHIVQSYTDRPKRSKNETGHTFLSQQEMDSVYNSSIVVAKTVYGEYRYCSTSEQLSKTKVNLYVVDKQGIMDLGVYNVLNKNVRLKTCMIERQNRYVSKERSKRDEEIPSKYFDYIISNNTNLDEVVETLDKLVNNSMGLIP